MPGNSGMNALANTLNDRIRKMNRPKTVADFGMINANTLALKTNSYAEAIPRGEYDVLESVGELRGGERVLVNWVDAYVVVIGIIS